MGVSLVLAGVPAILMTVGGTFLPETPNSIIERGHLDQAKTMLQKIRAASMMRTMNSKILSKRTRRRRRWSTHGETSFNHNTGLNLLCAASYHFSTVYGYKCHHVLCPGFGANSSLLSAIIICAVNVEATLVSIFTVDKFGRRVLFLELGVQILPCHVFIIDKYNQVHILQVQTFKTVTSQDVIRVCLT